MNVILGDPARPHYGWEGEAVGVSGQFLVVHLLYDPHGNKCGKRPLIFAEPGEVRSPVDWEAYR